MLKGSRRSHHGLSKPELFTTGRILIAVWIVVLAVVLGVILFGPERKPLPVFSKVTYEPKPEHDRNVSADFASDRSNSRTRDQEALMGKMVEYSKGRFIIVGTVKMKVDGKPIESAFISADFTGTPPEGTDLSTAVKRFGAYTDATGRCTLHVEYPGKYIIGVSRSGYLPCDNQELEVSDDAPQTKVVFELSQGAKVKGRVTEKVGGKGAAGIEVVATGDTWGRAKTDADGNYTITGLAKGEYSVSLDLSHTVYLTGGALPSKDVKLETADSTVSGIDFQVEAGGVVWGYVKTKDNEPIEHAGVLLCTSASIVQQLIDKGIRAASTMGDERRFDERQRLGLVAASSDAKGYYEMMGVGLGKEWRVISMGPETAPQLSKPFMLSQSQRTVRVDLTLAAGSTVRGRAITPKGDVVEGAEIACIPGFSKLFSPLDRPQAFRTTRSANDGSFELPHIPQGDYQIMSMKQGYKFALTGTQISPDGYNDLRGVEVVLTPVEAGQSTVFGTVTDGSGNPVSGVKVELANINIEALQPQEMSDQTDANGYYQLDGVSTGVLALHLTKSGYADKNITDVRLDTPTDIVMEAQSRVSGRVLVYETGAPAPGASVRAIRTATPTSTTSTTSPPTSGGTMAAAFNMSNMVENMSSFEMRSCNENGEFDFALAPGSYTLEGRSRGTAPGRVSVTISPGQIASNLTIRVRQSGARIQGRVTTSTGKPPDGATVSLRDSSMGGVPGPLQDIASQAMDPGQRNVGVGSDGSYEFTNLAAGTYVVCARLEGFATSQSKPVMLTDGETQSGINVTLTSGGTLQGYVSINGQLTGGAFVTLVGDSMEPHLTTSDSNGQYHLDNIPEGNYMAAAVSLGGGAGTSMFSPQHARVDITTGRVTTHNFGEPTNTALAGLCTPPPGMGAMGYAVLHLPGVNLDPASLDLRNPAAWFTGSGAIGSAIMGVGQVAGDGTFRIDNLVQGDYVLDVFYTSLNDLLAGRVRQVYSGPASVTNGQTAEINVPVVVQ